jgi:hypothetical protein
MNARAATRALAARFDVDSRRLTPADAPEADAVVWACGSWLPKLFPDLVEIRLVRRDVFFFGVDGAWASARASASTTAPTMAMATWAVSG